jgi:hypothetical protein
MRAIVGYKKRSVDLVACGWWWGAMLWQMVMNQTQAAGDTWCRERRWRMVSRAHGSLCLAQLHGRCGCERWEERRKKITIIIIILMSPISIL